MLKKYIYVHSDLDPDVNPDEEEEKQRLINQVLELQNTLDGMSESFTSMCQFFVCLY